MLEKKATRALKNDTRILQDDLITVSGERLADDKASAQAHRAFIYTDMRTPICARGMRVLARGPGTDWLRAAPQAGNDDSATTFIL